MTFAVHEVFATVQGEGALAGTPAVFVRFAGCNLWNGRQQDRERDAARNDARCPLFCDTNFTPRLRLSRADLVLAIVAAAEAAGMPTIPLVVFTGGEPLLQLDTSLLDTIRVGLEGPAIAIETNGTQGLGPGLRTRINHICMSPKVPTDRIALTACEEVKIVWPAHDPITYFRELGRDFAKHWWIAPEAIPGDVVGLSRRDGDRERAAAEWCMRHPPFKLSLQTHKMIGMP